MIKWIIVFLFLTIGLLSCNTKSDKTKNRTNNTDSIEQLEKEVLNAACDEKLKKDMKNRIDQQKKQLTKKQMIQSLKNMKQDMKC